jgi:hypothetical protein
MSNISRSFDSTAVAAHCSAERCRMRHSAQPGRNQRTADFWVVASGACFGAATKRYGMDTSQPSVRCPDRRLGLLAKSVWSPEGVNDMNDPTLRDSEAQDFEADIPECWGIAKVVPETARALSGGRRCQNCGQPLKGRQRRACSGRCRAASSRRRRTEEIGQKLNQAHACLSLVLRQSETGQP